MKNIVLRVLLGDLRHDAAGRHSVYMPIGIGYIAAAAIAEFGPAAIEVRLVDSPDQALSALASWRPHVVGMSHYCWNAEVSGMAFRRAKALDSSVICVGGGPHYPESMADRQAWLAARQETDFYVRREGEPAFIGLLRRLLDGTDVRGLKSAGVPGMDALHPETGQLVRGESIPKMEDLDQLPSPYLSGVMDPFFDGAHVPSIETARGCPYTCGYCSASAPWYSRVSFFSVERVKQEVDYIAERMRGHEQMLLAICDTNFGSYERDEEIADHMAVTQQKYGWPVSFDVTTGKSHFDRILRISAKLQGKLRVSTSLQSNNPETLRIIRRKNMPPEDFRRIIRFVKQCSGATATEFIAPLPGETRESFLNGLRFALEMGSDDVFPYTTMILPQTPLATREMREEHGLQTRFRVLPRCFGEYGGDVCVEYEEVCVSTADMSFEDYLDSRGVGLLVTLYSGTTFDPVRRLCSLYGVNLLEFIERCLATLKAGDSKACRHYRDFLHETENELFDSAESLLTFFRQRQNYPRLLSGELGDNLLRKYSTRMLLDLEDLADVACSALARLRPDCPVADVQAWLLATRSLRPTVFEGDSRRTERTLECGHDVQAWSQAEEGASLDAYAGPCRYRVFCDHANVERLLDELRSLYGEDLEYGIGKWLVHHSPDAFWSSVERRD